MVSEKRKAERLGEDPNRGPGTDVLGRAGPRARPVGQWRAVGWQEPRPVFSRVWVYGVSIGMLGTRRHRQYCEQLTAHQRVRHWQAAPAGECMLSLHLEDHLKRSFRCATPLKAVVLIATSKRAVGDVFGVVRAAVNHKALTKVHHGLTRPALLKVNTDVKHCKGGR